ncbi:MULTISPECIES: monovalent cation/H(+) antiporter subunit G [Actinoalloteichus]|uniref:Monovalent cation/proton antiporter, MnhG/PhaG subunit n=1 Tax=Actinoalloteichus fjordicus TaxID=1612552 RepID=A0AAC9LDI1_9PSEU|nr:MULTISPECIES: monovalent cation/H(+) antiporter subunit G [Actinoalloteichus]APU15853.1 monovalent cation/proton antiporter, MnhG/PhaG subunit [Actinoalloteichus fjordicus]APU21915.1 monovalent cation/proton antiporter, MnhG/PhaG subunit [Actinoalloteichus sp. GBA129-24]
MSPILDVLGVISMVLGGVVFAVGAFGLLRLPDFYSRLSGVSIAAGLGTALLLLGLLLHFPTLENALKLGLALLIQLATAAVGGNAMARAGYLAGTPATPRTRYDDLAVGTTDGPKPAPDDSRGAD